MLAVILVSSPLISSRQAVLYPLLQLNMFFLCASLRSLYKVTVGRFGKEQDMKPLVK